MDYTRREFLGTVSAAAALGGVARAADAQVSDDPLGVRRDFPVVDEMTYLDSAYITPSPRQAIAATPEGGTLYVIPTYTAMLDVRNILGRWSGRGAFWEGDAR